MTKAPAGSAGSSQACFHRLPSAAELDLVHVSRRAVAEDAQDDAQRQTDFGRGDDDHEDARR